MAYFSQQLINAITLGAIYGLIAIGYTMVYGIIGMVNFAHGEIFMIGAFHALITYLVLAIAAVVLGARIAEARHDYQKALDLFFKGIKEEDSLAYDEPPQWFHPVRESFGGYLLRRGNYVDAEGIFRNDLERNKHSGRSLFGLMESLKAQKRSAAAAAVQREFETAWKNADTKLSISDL